MLFNGEDMADMSLAHVVTSKDVVGAVDAESLELLFVGSVLHHHQFVFHLLQLVDLPAEDRRENTLRLGQGQLVLSRLVLAHTEEQDQARNLLNQTLGAAAANHCDQVVVHGDTRFDVQAVDLVLVLGQVQRPGHLLHVFSSVSSPLAGVEVERRTFDAQLRIDYEGEDSLVLPVDADVGCDVVAERKLGCQLPLVLGNVEALAASVLAATHHE